MFKNKIKPRTPVILTTEQLEMYLMLHEFAGSFNWKGKHVLKCACGKEIEGYYPVAHRHHVAAELSKHQG